MATNKKQSISNRRNNLQLINVEIFSTIRLVISEENELPIYIFLKRNKLVDVSSRKILKKDHIVTNRMIFANTYKQRGITYIKGLKLGVRSTTLM